MNMLIQGAAIHSALTLHYLVRDELDAINPKLISVYDRVAVGMPLVLWRGEIVLMTGRPRRFWSRIGDSRHPFHHHPLLARHGATLAEATLQHALLRARQKKAWTTPGLVSVQLNWLLIRAMQLERSEKSRLEELAVLATSKMWDMAPGRLDASLTTNVKVGEIRQQPKFRGRLYAAFAAGWSGVQVDKTELRIVAKAFAWPLLAHELVKGTAELVSLHGLNSLDNECYEAVMTATERVDFEPWHMQAGTELWRLFLAVIPADRSLSEVFMHIAQLDPRRFEAVMMAIVEEPEAARSAITAF
jgi:hypothetical protein